MDVKCVMVLANDLEPGLAVNAAGVLAVSLGFKVPSLLPPDAVDGSGDHHVGLINVPLPILVADRETLRTLRVRSREQEDLLVVDFSDVAQHARTYEDYVAALLTTYKFQGLYPPDTVFTTLTTSALVNAGVLKARGFDFELSYSLRTGFGNFNAAVNGTRMVKYLFQLLPTITPVDQLDTDRAPRWKVRSNINWSYAAVSANITWNYISSYRNFSVVPNERVKQFNTFDVRLAYLIPVGEGVEVSIRGQNILDKKAPYYAGSLGYDGAAASPLGREWQLAARFRF